MRLGKRWLLIALVLLVSVQGWWLYRQQKPEKKPLEEYARQVYEYCSKEGYRPSCYDKEIPKLMDVLTMEEAFAVTKLVQDRDPQYVYCHVLGHQLSFQESQKNKTHWKDILSRCPLAMCNYGCLHGSLVERFRGEVLTDEQIATILPDLQDVCEPRPGFAPNELQISMCYHALGHLALYVTGGKPERALPVCEKIALKPDGRDYLNTCAQGIFMTVFQGVDPEDIALVKDIKPEPERIPAFCAQYGQHWWACRRESYPSFREEVRTPQGLVRFCSYATSEEILKDCYMSVLNLFTVEAFEYTDGIDRVAAYCQGIPLTMRGFCYAGVGMRLVQIDPLRQVHTAVAVCTLGKAAGIADECYEAVAYYGRVSFGENSAEQRQYCQEVPSEWQETCLHPPRSSQAK